MVSSMDFFDGPPHVFTESYRDFNIVQLLGINCWIILAMPFAWFSLSILLNLRNLGIRMNRVSGQYLIKFRDTSLDTSLEQVSPVYPRSSDMYEIGKRKHPRELPWGQERM